jgi:cholera toxin transcriptional activator
MAAVPPDDRKRVFRFAVYEADSASGELRKSGVRIRLHEQAFQVLTTLLERPGEIVTREELSQKLWPADTFVDFDHGLNTVINKLREALGDSASNPRFIETLARRGYRFVAPVELTPSPGAAASIPPSSTARSASVSILTTADEVPSVQRRYLSVLFLLIQFMYLSFYISALARFRQLDGIVEQAFPHPAWIINLTLVSALIGLPIRLYLISSVIFGIKNFSQKFRKIFLVIFVLDEIWSLAPLLLAPQIGIGLALAATAALVYVPFSQRGLLLMGERSGET